MEHFKKYPGCIIGPALGQVESNPQLWNANPLRTQHQGTMHSQVDDIWIRFNEIKEDNSNILNDLETIWYPAKETLSRAVDLVFEVFQRERAVRLGRVFISRLKPQGRIARHIDEGDYPKYYRRFHIVLQGGKGSYFFCGDECVEMLTGQVWQFDNNVEHEVYNDSQTDRIHLIMDLKS